MANRTLPSRRKALPGEAPEEAMEPGAGAPGAPGGDPADLNADGVTEPEEVEKYSSQVLRRMHEDGNILLKEYHDMRAHLEHPEIDGYVERKLQNIVNDLEEIEGLHGTHHPEAARLEGAEEHAPVAETMNEEEAGKDIPENEAVEAASTGKETTPAQSVEAMKGDEEKERAGMKNLRNGYKTKTIKGKKKGGKLGIEGEHEPGEEEAHKEGRDYEDEDLQNTPGYEEEQEKPGEPGPHDVQNPDRDFGFEGEHDPGYEELRGKPLQAPEVPLVSEATEHLGELEGLQDHEFSEDHRHKAYHHAKTLHGLSGHDRDFDELKEQDEAAEVPEGPGGGGEEDRDPMDEEDEIAEINEPGEKKKKDIEEFHKDVGGEEGGSEFGTGEEYAGDKGMHKGMHKHRRHMLGAAKFLKGVANMRDSEWDRENHGQKSGFWHKHLDELTRAAKDSEVNIEPGEVHQDKSVKAPDLKALKSVLEKRQKDMLELHRKMKKLIST